MSDEKIVRLDPKRRFKLVWFDQIKPTSSTFYLVKGLLPREGLVVVWGPPKSGKSFWTFDLVMHVALGWEYRGRRVIRGTVVYVACEGERGLAARVEAFRREKMAEELTAPPFALLITRLDLVREVNVLKADILAQIGDRGCAAVVLDTLNRSINGDENSPADMGAYVQAANSIREAFGCAVIVIHHCGVEGSRPRGHTSLTGAADAQIAVKRDAGGQIVATLEWMKDGPEGEATVSTLKVIEVGTDEDGEPVTSCIVEPSDGAPGGSRKPKKINPAAKQALALMQEAMVDYATPAPATAHAPEGVLGVTKVLWRSYCENGGIINPHGNPREQLRRIIVTLKDAGLIGVWDDFVWPVTGRHKASP